MSRELWVVMAICVAGGLWHLHTRAPSAIERSPGTLAPDAPEQHNLSDGQAPIRIGDFVVTPLAEYRAEARLLSRERYSDEGSALAPLDFALGWGRMSDTAVIEQLSISQGARFFSYRWEDQPPIPQREIVVSAANVHLIPADEVVAAALHRLRVGQVIELKGYLVEAKRSDGWHWRSSLTREDSGGGACELMYVQEASFVR